MSSSEPSPTGAVSSRRLLIGPNARKTSIIPLDLLRDCGYEIVDATGHEGEFIAFIELADAARSREIVSRVRRLHTRRYGYIILLMTDATENPRAFLDAGADDVLGRPVEPGVLLSRVRVAERIARMQAELSAKNRHLEDLNTRMRSDLEAAARVQHVLLPAKRVTAPGLEVAWRFRPSQSLAGDILNCFQLDEDHLAFYVLDVSGHGVSAALLSVQVARMMSPMMSESELLKKRLDKAPWYRLVDPIDVVRQLNDIFGATERMTHYFTIVFGLMDLRSREIRFVSAGHPGPVHVTRGGAEVIQCSGTPVGLLETPRLEQKDLVLQPGERIWFYSDGICDAEDAAGTPLGPGGLLAEIERTRGLGLEEAADEVLAMVQRWSRRASPDDDCSLLALGTLGGPEERA